MEAKFSYQQQHLLDKYDQNKSKEISTNQVPYMTKNFRKEVMKRSQLKTKYFKFKTAEILRMYKK